MRRGRTSGALMRSLGALLALPLGAPVLAADLPQRMPAKGSVEVAFAPRDDAEGALLRAIEAARDAIYVQSYAFTSRQLASALVAASRRGVRVAVLADAQMNRRPKGNVLSRLVAAGIPVALETAYAAAHNKVMVIDPHGARPAVVTGSYNFTWSAAHRNAENLLILRDNPVLAEAYLANWEHHRERATPVDRKLEPLAK